MFGVYRYVRALREAIARGENPIKWSAHSSAENRDNSVTLATELLKNAGYRLVSDKFSFARGSRVLIWEKPEGPIEQQSGSNGKT